MIMMMIIMIFIVFVIVDFTTINNIRVFMICHFILLFLQGMPVIVVLGVFVYIYLCINIIVKHIHSIVKW